MLPHPVPPLVEDAINALGGEHVPVTQTEAQARFVLHFLDAKGESAHISPSLTGYQLKTYVYEFNSPLSFLQWRMKLVLTFTFAGETYTFTKLFNLETPPGSRKGTGSRIRIVGDSAKVTEAVRNLRLRLASSVNQRSSGPRGFSSSRPVRPNETKNSSFTELIYSRASGTSPWTGTPATKVYVGYSRNWTGTRTPGFGKLKAQRLPVNPHTVSMRKTFNGPSHAASFNVSTGSASGTLSNHTKWYPGALEPLHNSKSSAIALNRLQGKAGLERQNLAETVATLGQTRDMVIGNIRRITGTLSALRSGNIPLALKRLWGNANPRYRRRSKGPSASRDLASNWLELQYGWKPLINDVHWGMQAVSKLSLSDYRIVRTTASARVKTEVSTVVKAAIASPPDAGFEVITNLSSSRYVMEWRYHDELLSLLSQAGFTNPVSLAWELIPFSFVVDWFLPLGPYFEQLAAWDGLVFLRGSNTLFTRQWTDFDLSYHRTSPFNSNVRDWGSSNYHDEWIKLNRLKLSAFPGAVLPSVRSGLSSFNRVANAVALLRQFVK